MISFICRESKKSKMKKKQTQAYGYTEWMVPEPKGSGIGKVGEGDQNILISVIELITHGDVMYTMVDLVNNTVF